MSINVLALAVPAVIVGLHYKYVTLWYGGNGGLKGYWSEWTTNSPQTKLAKILFFTSVVFATISIASSTPLPYFGIALISLLAHFLLLMGYRA